MDAKAALNERTEMLDNVYNFRPNKRVPLGANFHSWQMLDAGYTFTEALGSYELMEKINREFHERYQFDVYIDLLTRNPMQISDLIGGFHKIDATGEQIYVEDHCILEAEEYPEFIEDPAKVYWTDIFRRHCKKNVTLGELRQAAYKYRDYLEYSGKMLDIYIKEYGVLMYYCSFAQNPFEQIFLNLRGMREVSYDLRKNKSQLKEVLDKIFETETLPNLNFALTREWTGFVAPISLAFLGHSVLSVRQFEEFFWPYLKKVIDAAVQHKKRIMAFSESTILRFAEFFQEIPKGVLLLHPEQDDIFEVRKKLPNIALSGGMYASLLGEGTEEQCVNRAKELIDTMGDGYVLSQDKMMSFRPDCKRENLLAVNEFVRNYH
jgi:hypothetical protein